MIPTKDKLALVLRQADLPVMAVRAAKGYYDDFLSPLDDPALALDRELVAAGTPAALAIRARHHQGEFDATREESDAWAKSPDGQRALRELMKKK